MKYRKCCIAIFCVLSLTFSTLFATSAKTVKVGFYSHGIYLNKSSMNVYDGYDVEFLYEIAKYTNWKYDFIDFKDFESAFDAVKKGEVDMITNASQIFHADTQVREAMCLGSTSTIPLKYNAAEVPQY